jgi:hypothetical protein
MPFGFKSVSHFFASVGKDLVSLAKSAGPVVSKIDATVVANAPAIEAATALVDPSAVAIENAAFSLFGSAVQAIQTADQAALDKGLDLSLDAQTVTDLKTLIPAVEKFAQAKGQVKPTA